MSEAVVVLFVAGCLLTCFGVNGESSAAEVTHEKVVYKGTDQGELTLDIFQTPSDETDRPAIVFFHGGGWNGGTPAQFFDQCRHLAARGMVGISVQYRLKNVHGTDPFTCLMDAVTAMRWVRRHAGELGIDPDRIAAGGGSAGGHLAAGLATLDVEWLDEDEDKSVSYMPNALVLYNPVYDNGPDGFGHERIGERYVDFSPMHNIHAGMPPTIVMLGDSDHLIPVATGEAFQQKMQDVGVMSQLIIYPDQKHGFFNPGRGGGEMYRQTNIDVDAFLTELGWITPKP